MKTGYISRRAVLNLLKEMSSGKAEEGTWEDGWETAVDHIQNAVINFRTTKAENAEWKQDGDIIKCSGCDYSLEHGGYLAYFNFCPSCGAKMS